MSRFLVVDDNVAFAENVAEILGDGGAEVMIAASGAEAIALARLHRFDALVSDMRMPEMSGTEVVRRLRQIDAGLPAIIVSAYSGDDALAEARHLGVLGVLPKPVPVPRLLGLLEVARRDGLVAIVDDDLAFADNLREILGDAGYASVVVNNVDDVERLDGAPLFAAIVDLCMPGGPDGEAMRRVARRFPSLPLLVATGHPELAPPVAACARLEKPLKPESLVAQLHALYAAHVSP
ncbi:MAG TPA: response regulator [Polyangia bacterium]